MAVDLRLTKAELQEQAEELGVSSAGTKADIAARIEAAKQGGQCPHCPYRTRAGDMVLAAHRSQAHHRKE